MSNDFTTGELITLMREEGSRYAIMLDNRTLRLYVDYFPEMGRSVIEAALSPFTEKLDEAVVEYPASWWQHVKQDLFPEWILSMFPVVHEKVTIDIKAAYPLVSLPEEESYVYFTKRRSVRDA